jgi:hypothetical protein
MGRYTMGDQNYHDAILWIGQSYATILCKQAPEACYFGPRHVPRRCFAHEAEIRGCCRKIPKAPSWLVPGKSRIFLAHRDGQEDPAQGCIFGYFVLKRFELIVDEATYAAVTREDEIPWIEALFQEIVQAILDMIEEEITGELSEEYAEKLREATREQFDRRWSKGFRRQIGKGTGISSRRRSRHFPESPTDTDTCDLLEELAEELIEELIEELLKHAATPQGYPDRDAERRELSKKCGERLREKAQKQLARRLPGDPQRQPRLDIHRVVEKQVKELIVESFESDEVLHQLRAQDSSRTNALIPSRATVHETHRSCSKRLKPGATYLVDALAAEITDAFTRRLASQMPATIREGEELFEKTVREVGKAHRKKAPLTEIYPGLEKHVTLRGELALFGEPYPVFARKPEAAFRGLLRLDGEQLLREVRASYEKVGTGGVPAIPYWCEKPGPWTPARLAKRFGFTKARTRAILQLYKDAFKSLEPDEYLDLPLIGRFTVENEELHLTPLPN